MSWLDVPGGSPFPLHNLPFGVGALPDGRVAALTAIGDDVVDLDGLVAAGVLDATPFVDRLLDDGGTLNEFAAAGRPVHRAVRAQVADLLGNPAHERAVRSHLIDAREVRMRLPVEVGDIVDFYSSIHHATNLGEMFRPGGDALLPNWRHLPVGYHGRAGTIVPDGTEVTRPHGLRPAGEEPRFGPTEALDIELEVGFVVGSPSAPARPIAVADAERHLLGVCLVNDWSARDIQSFEYQPLGPFLGKSFATSMSPWIVTLDALEPFRVDPVVQDPQPASHLRSTPRSGFDLHLEVLLQSEAMRHAGTPPLRISTTEFADIYWTPAQQLAHMTSNGAHVRPGDLFASGTVSGPATGSEGSLIELARAGERPIELPDGSTRAYLADGDRITLTGWAGRDPTTRIGLGSVTGTIAPAPPLPPGEN